MFNLIALAIILISLALILFIVIRKFPQLSQLNIDHLPEEQERRKKRALLTERFNMRGRELETRWKKRLEPLRRLFSLLQLQFRVYVGKIERLWHHEQMQKKRRSVANDAATGGQREKIELLLIKAREAFERLAYDEAEALFIQAISLNPRSVEAYRGLGDTYYAKGAMSEAEETYQFLLQLTPGDYAVMVKIAEIEADKGNLEAAISWYQQAVIGNDTFSPYFYRLAELLLKLKQPIVAREAILSAAELEPKNPKYLDLLIEVALQCRDRELAERGWNELRLVNPENQKLEGLKNRIGEMQS